MIATNIRSKYVRAPATPVNDLSDDDKTSMSNISSIAQNVNLKYRIFALLGAYHS